jgi:hypothetical protein
MFVSVYLDQLPATRGHGFEDARSDTSSWGNAARHDPVSGKWFMANDEMANHCGMLGWEHASRCVLTQADNASGPYTRVAVMQENWCHGSFLERDPISGRWLFRHMGSGNSKWCWSCSNGTTPMEPKWVPCETNGSVKEAGAFVSKSTSPLEGWGAAGSHVSDLLGANDEAFFMTNGTVFFSSDRGDNYPNCPKQCFGKCRNMKAVSRAESLADAMTGNFTYTYRGATQVLLGGSNSSSANFCAS